MSQISDQNPDVDPSANPYAPPQATLGPPSGTHRYYGLAITELKLADLWRLTKNPLVWLRLFLTKWLIGSRAVVYSGLLNPQTPQELQIAEFPPHIRWRLARRREALEQAGFRWAGHYRGPSIGLAHNIGDTWVDAQDTVCLSLLIQSLSFPRVKSVAEYVTLTSPRGEHGSLITTNYPIQAAENPANETQRLPGADLPALLALHRQRLAAVAASATPSPARLTNENVWDYLLRQVKREITALEQAGVIFPLSEAEAVKLDSYSAYVDFRDRRFPWLASVFMTWTTAFAVYLVSLLGVLARWPNARAMLYASFVWLAVSVFFSPRFFRWWFQARPEDQLPPRDLRAAPVLFQSSAEFPPPAQALSSAEALRSAPPSREGPHVT